MKNIATRGPYIRSMRIDTIKLDWGCASAGTKSRHGTTPMIERLMAR